mgnify:CR=1 FL=1
MDAQIRIYEDGSYIKAELTEEDKEIIMETATRVVNSYVTVASFQDESGNFSDESYAEFVSLFSGSAEVYDDLAKKDAQNINYATYADKVFQYMQGTGVNFELNETYLDEITYDSSGFYMVQISFEKIMFNGLNEDNEITNFPNNGKSNDLKMIVEIPEYDLTSGSIVSILGEAKQVRVDAATQISADLNYHLGNVLKTSGDNSPGFQDALPVGYNSYGVDVVFRRSINQKKSIFLLAGVSAGFHNFSSDLSGIDVSVNNSIPVQYGGLALMGPGQLQAGNVPSTRLINTNNSNSVNLTENLQVIDIQVPLGVSLRLIEKYNYDVMLDISVVPTYSIASSGTYEGQINYIQIPDDEAIFPEKFVTYIQQQIAAGVSIPEYAGSFDYNEELVETENNFSAAAQITPLYHYKFNFNMALELGLNISYGFLPYFQNETNHLGAEQSNILEITGNTGAQNPSILQNNYQNVGILRYGARVGIVFKL